ISGSIRGPDRATVVQERDLTGRQVVERAEYHPPEDPSGRPKCLARPLERRGLAVVVCGDLGLDFARVPGTILERDIQHAEQGAGQAFRAVVRVAGRDVGRVDGGAVPEAPQVGRSTHRMTELLREPAE